MIKALINLPLVAVISLVTVAAGNHFEAPAPGPKRSPKTQKARAADPKRSPKTHEAPPPGAKCSPKPREAPAPDLELARTVGQLARGMRHIVEVRDGGRWWRCGKRLDPWAQKEESTRIAWALVREMKGLGLDVDPWGIAGTMYNESGFDPCALGLNPRRWAYARGVLSKRRTGRSHTRKEVLAVVNDPRAVKYFKVSGFDLGLCQVLSRFYRSVSFDYMTTVHGGARICALEMQARAQYHKTRTPWSWWRGINTPWYTAKINRWRRIMKGAS